MTRRSSNPNWILPPGTQVVMRAAVAADGDCGAPAGAVAVILRAPTDPKHAYLVRFADGAEASLRRTEFDVLKDVQRGPLGGPDSAPAGLTTLDVGRHVIFRCVIGSRAYGLEQAESDIDRRGVYVAPAELHWSLFGAPKQIEDQATQECYWELQKFLTLALKANPNILECLYTPIVEQADELGRELLAIRGGFLSKLIYQTYNGYVLSQFRKLEGDLRNRGEIRWKHAMHLIRLLLSGIVALREGYVPVRVAEQRERLLAVRQGVLAWDEVNSWRLELHREFDAAFATTTLPDRADFDRANALLIKARRRAAADAGASS